jgi:hypothetical protein
MKNKLIFIVFIILLVYTCEKITDETYPPPPENYSLIASPVNLNFKVTNMNLNSVEMSLTETIGSSNLFCLFKLSDDWIKGDFGLVLTDMSANSILTVGAKQEEPDISRFKTDNSGKEVKFYTFDNTLVEDDKGAYYMRMSYIGPSMPLIESLKLEKNIRLPLRISSLFVDANTL